MGGWPKLALRVNKFELLHQISISKSQLPTPNPVILVLAALELAPVNKSSVLMSRTFPLPGHLDVLLSIVRHQTDGMVQAMVTL